MLASDLNGRPSIKSTSSMSGMTETSTVVRWRQPCDARKYSTKCAGVAISASPCDFIYRLGACFQYLAGFAYAEMLGVLNRRQSCSRIETPKKGPFFQPSPFRHIANGDVV